MKLNMKLGAEPKKVGILVGLLVAAFFFYLYNRNSGDSSAPARPAGSTAATNNTSKGPIRPVSHSVRVTQNGVGPSSHEFRPKFGKSAIDPSSVDPTLHLAELARLQDVKIEPTTRASLFETANAPPTPLSAVKEPPKIVVDQNIGPKPPPPPPPPPPTPDAPKIPLKFYGFVNPAKVSPKRAFFLLNDEIIIANEGDMVSKRYKIIRIGVNSAVVEDTVFKGNNTQQTLPLEAELPG